MPEILELVARFLTVGALAFGGGGAALPLVERFTVAETGWLTPRQFAVGVGFAYATPARSSYSQRSSAITSPACPARSPERSPCSRFRCCSPPAPPDIVQRLNKYARFRAFRAFRGGRRRRTARRDADRACASVVDIHPALLIGSALVFAGERAGLSPVLLLVVAVVVGAGTAFVG